MSLGGFLCGRSRKIGPTEHEPLILRFNLFDCRLYAGRIEVQSVAIGTAVNEVILVDLVSVQVFQYLGVLVSVVRCEVARQSGDTITERLPAFSFTAVELIRQVRIVIPFDQL